MSQTSYLRFPHITGDLLTFVAENDVWLAELPADGAGGSVRAARFTSDRQPVKRPRLSPDGARVAWVRRRDGAPEVYAAPVDGGAATRLTYWADWRTDVLGWASGEQVIAAGGEPAPRGYVWAYAVPVDGGVPVELPYGTLQALAVNGPGGAVMTRRGVAREAAAWKRYRGGGAGKLWIDADGSGDFRRILRSHEGNIESPMWVGDRAAFLSDAGGVAELYSCSPDGSDLRQHTDQPSEFFARHAASDGTRVVFMRQGRLWLLDELDGEARPLDVRLTGTRIGRTEHPVAASGNLSGYAADRTGRAAAVAVRGTVHWLAAKDGPARALAVTPGVRARMPVVLGETGFVAWVTDAGGEWSIEIGSVDGDGGGRDDGGRGSGGREGGGSVRRILTGEVTRVVDLVASPDGAHLAVATHDNRLLVVAVESGTVRVAAAGLHNSYGAFATGPVFSPDSRWLAWSEATLSAGPRKIRLADVATLTACDVTDGRFRDWSPAFTVDGKHLAFLSTRTYDPYYADGVFDLYFVPGDRPYLVPLAADEPSPFAPSLRGRPIGEDSKSGSEGSKSGSDADSGSGGSGGSGGSDGSGKTDRASGSRADVRVDVEGIAGRIVPFPVPAGDYTQLRAAKGGVLWVEKFSHGALGDSKASSDDDEDKPRLRRYDFAKRDVLTLADEASSFDVSGDGNRVLVSDGNGALRLQPADSRPDNGDREPLDLERIRVSVDPVAERRQCLREAWLLQREFFWRDDLGGLDWPAVWERYAPLAEAVATEDDLADVLWEMQGELGTSHAYVSGTGGGADPARLQGRLGADLERDSEGRWRITRILPGDASVPRARSPFEAPGVGARVGDVVAAIDGRAVDPASGPGPLLAGKAGKPTEVLLVRDAAADGGGAGPAGVGSAAGAGAAALSAADTDGPAALGVAAPSGAFASSTAVDAGAVLPSAPTTRRVVIVPLENEDLLRYHAWVADRRAHVRQRSAGRLGYVHLPDQGSRGWAEFHRDLTTQTACEGLIVDTRGNGGGSTSALVAEQLMRRVAGWDLARGRAPRTYPPVAVRGPLVSVCDEYSASDGDIINQYLKDRGVPIVGTRTWGGVVGIDAAYRLLDGTGVTQPKYMSWFDSVGYGLENHGCDPTVEVEFTPADANARRDPQLDAAVDLALAELAEHPAATPPERPWM